MDQTPRPTEVAYAELQQAFDFYNKALFEGALQACLITFQRQKTTMGYFSGKRFARRDGAIVDEIAMNPEYFAVVPLIEVLQTLVHEMTHLWQAHKGKPSRACYHNSEWADKMESIGLMPSSTGRPGGRRVGQQMADYVIVGSPFALATHELLERGFLITWLDRYPARMPPAILPASFDSAHSPAEGHKGIPGIPPAAFVVPVHTPAAAMIQEQKAINRSNRSKYVCSSCGLAVWGKPGIRIACITCDNTPLDESGINDEGAEL